MLQEDRWEYRPDVEPKNNSLVKYYGAPTIFISEHPWMMQLLKKRYYLEVPDIELHKGLTAAVAKDHPLYEACVRLIKALRLKQDVFIWGDYDTDGITATCCLYTCLKTSGLHVSWGLPSRLEEGYGVNAKSIMEQAPKGALIVTVDNGITSQEPIAELVANGYEVLVTDHHLPEGDLPKCQIVNPKLYCTEDQDEYMASGCYVAGKLGLLVSSFKKEGEFLEVSEELWNKEGIQGNLFDYVQALVGMSLISDNIPMNPTMRLACLRGITAINTIYHDGIRALLQMCGARENQNITSMFLAYSVIPKINAAGRMGQPIAAAKVLLQHQDKSLGKTETLLLANKLKYMNADRKIMENQIFIEAMQMASRYPYKHSIVLYKPTWHPGVLGIIAARIAEAMFRPTIIIAQNGDHIEGSGRTIGDFDLHGALEQCREHLVRFGGHKAAAGLGIEENKIEAFRKAFDECVEKANIPQYLTYLIDAEVTIRSLYDMRVLLFLENFEPIAKDNPEIIFKLTDVYVLSVKYRGDVGSILVRDEEDNTLLISKYRPRVDLMDYMHRTIDVLFSPQAVYFGGTTSFEWRLQSIHTKGA